MSKAEGEEKARMVRASKQEKNADRKRIEEKEEAAARAEAHAFDAAWSLLPEPARRQHEAAALATANRLQRAILERGGVLAAATRRSLLRRGFHKP